MEGVESSLTVQLHEALQAQHQAQLQLTEELRNQVAALQHQTQNQNARVEVLKQAGARSLATEPQLAHSERFGGQKDKLRDFILVVRTIFDLQPFRYPNDRVKILFIGTLLEGPPLSWFCVLHEEPIVPAELQSLTAFLLSFE